MVVHVVEFMYYHMPYITSIKLNKGLPMWYDNLEQYDLLLNEEQTFEEYLASINAK